MNQFDLTGRIYTTEKEYDICNTICIIAETEKYVLCKLRRKKFVFELKIDSSHIGV